MSERQTIVLNYTPLESGNAESRWIRVEQETPEDESLTVGEAAAVIDSIYEIEPCDDGMGGGGEGDDGTDAPDEDKVDAALAAMLARAGMCDEAKFWTATVRVYRSHRQPGYVLRSETATVETTEPVRESRRQEVEVSGAVIELDMPYDGGLTGIPAGVKWEVRGSTVNLDRPVNGRLVLRYTTYYERVTLRVPTDAGAAEGGQGAGVAFPGSGGRGGEVAGGEKPARPELQAASVVAFWGDLAASCDLNPPEQDDADGIDIDRICNKGSGSGGSGDDSKDCWKTIAHYRRCNCSYKKVDEWEEQVAAPCDGAVSGAGVGYEEQFGGFVWCEGEEDEVSDPEYYEKRCCHPPPSPLPRCRKSYELYNGGAEIENGPEHWKNIYGADVAMIAVMPEGGTCGEKITEWNVPQKNCCDDAEPLTPHPRNPETIHAPGSVLLEVLGGAPDTPKNPHKRRWRASAGYYFDADLTVSYVPDGGNQQRVWAAPDACDNAVIQVDDGCSRLHMRLRRDNPSDPMRLLPAEATVAPGAMIGVEAHNAQGDVRWTAGRLRLLTPQGAQTAVFQAPDDFCGTDQVVAADACGKIAAMTVLGTRGTWVPVDDFDPCSSPCGGAVVGRYSPASGYEMRCGAYRAQGLHEESGDRGFPFPSGSCQEAWERRTSPDPRNPCGFNDVELFTREDGGSVLNNASGFDYCGSGQYICDSRMCRHQKGETPGWYYQWRSASQWITALWKWECEE